MTTRPLRLTDHEALEIEPRIVEPTALDPRASSHPVEIDPPDDDGRRRIEVVIHGWRFVFDVEDAGRAELRERASRAGGPGADAAGTVDIRAIIPGRVVTIAVVEGDDVAAGQPLLVVEAMKMQNELTAPRGGTVTRVAVAAGDTVDLGDVLVTLG